MKPFFAILLGIASVIAFIAGSKLISLTFGTLASIFAILGLLDRLIFGRTNHPVDTTHIYLWIFLLCFAAPMIYLSFDTYYSAQDEKKDFAARQLTYYFPLAISRLSEMNNECTSKTMTHDMEIQHGVLADTLWGKAWQMEVIKNEVVLKYPLDGASDISAVGNQIVTAVQASGKARSARMDGNTVVVRYRCN